MPANVCILLPCQSPDPLLSNPRQVVEMAPAEGLPPATRTALFDDAVRLTSAAKYLCAGTVEFLVDKEGRHYFIEVRVWVVCGV